MIRSGEMLVSLTQGKAPDPLQELTASAPFSD
jgi:hypothetical protein